MSKKNNPSLRLADRIIMRGIHDPMALMDEEFARKLEAVGTDIRGLVSRAEIISAENVANYLYETMEQSSFNLLRDFPNIAPVFPIMLIEASRPRFLRMKKGGIDKEVSGFPKHWGLLFQSDNLTYDSLAGFKRDIIKDVKALQSPEIDSLLSGPVQDSYGWSVMAHTIIEHDNGNIFGPFLPMFMLVATDGRLLSPPWVMSPQSLHETITASIQPLIYPALLALCFMHCRNVQIVKHEPTGTINRAQRRSGITSRVKYYTLQIEPIRKVLATEGQSESQGLKRALHICRGHFADYSEKGLFGRFKGRFWIPAHIRGSAEHGAILKDYKVSS